MAEFKDILQNLRKDRRMTQDELADALHITKQALSHYERGTRYPRRDTLDAIADFFNVDLNFLTGYSTITTQVLTPQETDLVISYRSASPDTQKAVRAVLGIAEQGGEQS